MLQDAFARRFRYLRLSLTESCNFRCSYCLPNGSGCDNRAAELTVPEIQALLRGFAQAGTHKVRLTGGEPTLRRDLCDIIAAVRTTPGINEVAMTTNGYRLHSDIDAWLEAGLTALNVSIDSLDAATFHLVTGQDRLPHILKGVDRALALGIRQLKINTVLLRQHNLASLPDFLAFVRDTPVTLRLIELMQTGDNHGFFRRQHVSANDIATQLRASGWQQLVRAENAGPAIEFAHPDYQGRIGLIMPYSNDFCASCNRLRVSSTGQLYTCLFATEHHDLRELLHGAPPSALVAFIRDKLQHKAFSHSLQQGQTGLTQQLAMIGG